MTFEEVFGQAKELFAGADVSSIKEHLAYQFNVTGDGAGTFYVEVKDGQLYVEPYDYNDRDAGFTAKADVFFKIVQGKLDPVFAFTTGKLKVDGSIDRALKIKEIIDCVGK